MRNARGTNTFTKGPLQTDVAFVWHKTKMPFQIHKKLHQTKMPIQISSHRRKNSARRAAGPPATSENSGPQSQLASTPEDPTRYEIRLSVGFNRISQRDLLGNRDLAEHGIQPDLWVLARSGEIRPSVGFGRMWDPTKSLKPTPPEHGFSVGSNQKSCGRTGERGEREIAGDGGDGEWVQPGRVFLFFFVLNNFTIKLTWTLIWGSTSVCKLLFVKVFVHVAFLTWHRFLISLGYYNGI